MFQEEFRITGQSCASIEDKINRLQKKGMSWKSLGGGGSS
jgi:hypothetical protein